MVPVATAQITRGNTALRRDPEVNPRVNGEVVPLFRGERTRIFDLQAEDPEKLIKLKEAVYGKPVNREVFNWQHFGHPRSRDHRIFVVEQDGELIASTTRMPAQIRLNGAEWRAYFNIDSMVHPAHRGCGRMRDLYRFARQQIPGSTLMFSKGSSPQIYPLLLSHGNRDITPNTYLVNYPSAARWIMTRLHIGVPQSRRQVKMPAGFEDFRPIERFDGHFDAFFERISWNFGAIFERDAAYMNWRYIDVPHRHYYAFERIKDDRMVEVVVLAMDEGHGHIVDVLWDPSKDAERSILFSQAFFNLHQAVRISCFSTHAGLRSSLGRYGFIDRGETPRFSARLSADAEEPFLVGGAHVVDGDGDTEFS